MRPIYMDNAATTRLDPRVLEAMLPYFTERYGNAASRAHAFGWEAEEAVEIAREQVAGLIGAPARSLVFTSGATEANNLAIKGVLAAYAERGRHLVTSRIEHPSVLDAARAAETDGAKVTYLPVDEEGRVDPSRVAEAIAPETVLVSVIHGNNEIGTVQDLAAISRVCRERGVLLHTDATQSLGRWNARVDELGVDLLSCSGHKLHGPKGVGALFVRRRSPRVRLRPQLDGGGHEGGLRSGTLDVPAIVGFGLAAEIAGKEREEDAARIGALRDLLESKILAQVEGVVRNTPPDGRLPHILNLGFSGLEGESLLLGLRGVAVSSGSACASASLEPSPVLLALGRKPAEARSALRFSLGRFNTEEEVGAAAEEVATVVAELRRARAAHEKARLGG